MKAKIIGASLVARRTVFPWSLLAVTVLTAGILQLGANSFADSLGVGRGSFTVASRLEMYGKGARERLLPFFEEAHLTYPPSRIALLGFKEERKVELYAAGSEGRMRFVRSYPILAASGAIGPKLREGDWQVPEGIYKIESLNPNSSFHLSLRVNYPNRFDRERGDIDGRSKLGGDIMIHGGWASIGCLAMGDPVAEELFTLSADVGIKNIEVILSPLDLRVKQVPQARLSKMPPWAPDLYKQLGSQLQNFKAQEN